MTSRGAIFDMDGTLADSTELAYLAARDGLVDYYRERGLEPRIPSRSDLTALLGLPSLEYFAGLLPPERRADAAALRSCVSRHERDHLAAGRGRLFDGVWEMLQRLRERGFRLGLVSNCGQNYLDANLEHLRLREVMEVAYCLDHLPSKIENVRAALADLGCREGVMVGDRRADIEAGRANGLRTVGCTYGFGTREELAEADVRIDAPRELPAVLERAFPDLPARRITG
ncbi:MAG TPA: HAD family hydrolase [Polyangia bacterium]|nr:HAD family hydrolase [Polyangia bacterium]